MDKEIADFRKIARKRLVQLVKEAENTLESSKKELKHFEECPEEAAFIIGFESSPVPEEFGLDIDWDVFYKLRDCLNDMSVEAQRKILDYTSTLYWEDQARMRLQA